MKTTGITVKGYRIKDGKLINMVVPYPLGFWAKGLDGRIDDPNAGWKGRGLWAANGDRTPWLIEGGKGVSATNHASAGAWARIRLMISASRGWASSKR